MSLENHSEAIPPAEKRIKVTLFLTPTALAQLEEYRLFEMGMAKKYRTLGHAVEEILTKHNFHLDNSSYWKNMWLTTVMKGRKIMEKRMKRLEEKGKA